MNEIRAKDVTVEKFFRARCHLARCWWTGAEHATFAAASAEREAHMTWHRSWHQVTATDSGDTGSVNR